MNRLGIDIGRVIIDSPPGARHHDFFTRTGIPDANTRFCLRRPDKAIHCAELGITHFVDDKPDVHEALADLVPHRYLFGPQRTSYVPQCVQPTAGRAEVEARISVS
jgi:hypothetical protein